MTTSPTHHEIVTVDDLAALGRVAAERFAAAAVEGSERGGRFAACLAGGSTPLAAYRLLGGALRSRVPWEETDIFFGDERCVPPGDPASNFGAARAALLSHVPLARVHRIEGERGCERAARDYDETLRASFPDADGTTFDVTLLGVGTDGHTASLFPGSPALDETARLAVAVAAPTSVGPHLPRVTLTLPMLRRSREVWFLCAGADKREVVSRILSGTAPDLPAARVRGSLRTLWIVDRAAIG